MRRNFAALRPRRSESAPRACATAPALRLHCGALNPVRDLRLRAQLRAGWRRHLAAGWGRAAEHEQELRFTQPPDLREFGRDRLSTRSHFKPWDVQSTERVAWQLQGTEVIPIPDENRLRHSTRKPKPERLRFGAFPHALFERPMRTGFGLLSEFGFKSTSSPHLSPPRGVEERVPEATGGRGGAHGRSHRLSLGIGIRRETEERGGR